MPAEGTKLHERMMHERTTRERRGCGTGHHNSALPPLLPGASATQLELLQALPRTSPGGCALDDELGHFTEEFDNLHKTWLGNLKDN
jgi:hypothetical protein